MGNVLCLPCSALHAYLFTPVKVFAVNHRRLKSLRLLGEGGFARVYLVQDMKTKRLFALKQLLCDEPGDLEDVLWEVGVHRTFAHPNIQRLVDYAIEQHPSGHQQVLMLLPYFAAGTLCDQLRASQAGGSSSSASATTKASSSSLSSLSSSAYPSGPGLSHDGVKGCDRTPYTENGVLDLIDGLASALREFHSHDPAWAHRDVKSENVLIADNGTPVLTDFGSVAMSPVAVATTDQARRLQDAIDTRTSPLYRAPELFDVSPGQILGEKCDVWGLGCVAWAAAFGSGPFDADAERGGVPALSVLTVPSFPENSYSAAFLGLLRSLMAIDPEDRPGIEQVFEEIEAVRKAINDIEEKRYTQEHQRNDQEVSNNDNGGGGGGKNNDGKSALDATPDNIRNIEEEEEKATAEFADSGAPARPPSSRLTAALTEDHLAGTEMTSLFSEDD